MTSDHLPIQFSVIIPLYNKAKFVKKAINSVLSQTFVEFELIIVNDGSTDDSAIVVQDIIDYRIRIIEQKNEGVSAARNNGVKIAKYDNIAFLDADDWWDIEFLSNMKDLIDSYPNAGIYGSSYYIVKNNQKREASIGLSSNFKFGIINYLQVYVKNLCMPLTSISVVIPKKIFSKESGFKENLKFGEDFDLWLRIALKHPVAFTNKPLAFYNQDVELANRAVGNLHNPANHVLWNLGYLSVEEKSNKDLKQLLDKLRVYSLYRYLLSKKFHALAKIELQKVNWGVQPMRARLKYKTPVNLLKIYYFLMKTGSIVKQRLISILKHIS
jgi:glycosyltransferase involved in cell wall biosynthesis